MRKKPGSTSIVRIPNGATSGASDSIQPSTPNFDAAYAVRNSPPTMPAVEEIVTTSPERWPRMTGRAARVTLTGPNRVVSICARNSSGVSSSKNPALKLPALLTSTSIRPNRSTARLDGGLGAGGVGDVKSYDDEVVVCSEHGGDLLGVAAGGDDGVTGSQGGLGDIDAHAATGAGDEPDIVLITHADALLLLDPQVVLGTASSVVHCYRTTRRPRVGAPDDGATDRDPLPSGSAPRGCCPACFVLGIAPRLAPLLGGRALHATAVRLALIIMAVAGLAGVLLVIARKALRMV